MKLSPQQRIQIAQTITKAMAESLDMMAAAIPSAMGATGGNAAGIAAASGAARDAIAARIDKAINEVALILDGPAEVHVDAGDVRINV